MEESFTGIGAVIDFFISAWLFMISLGALHHHYNQIPNISYAIAMLVVLAVWALVPAGVFQINTIRQLVEKIENKK